MSYDVTIADKSFNYTSNGGFLYHDHLPALEGNNGQIERRSGLQALNGLTGREAGELLLQMLTSINQERIALGDDNEVGEQKMCAKYDAPNGWGSLVGQLIFVGKIAAACAAHPDDFVSVS